MNDKEPKTLIRFSLTPEGKELLRAFFAENFEKLKSGDEETKKELQRLIKEDILPENAELQQTLHELFSGASHYALLIENLPERSIEEIPKGVAPESQDAYSYHIGNALFNAYGIQQTFDECLVRETRAGRFVSGEELHRDFATSDRFAALSVLDNRTHGKTEITDVLAALQEMPEDVRKRGIAHVHKIKCEGEVSTVDTVRMEAGELLAALKDETPVKWIKQISYLSGNYETALKPHGAEVDLQPGQLLLWDERNMFHQAYDGDYSRITPDDSFARVAIRTAGRAENSI